MTRTDRPGDTLAVGDESLFGYLLRRWWRVRRSIFLCFFFRMRLRRFLISEPTKRRRYRPRSSPTNRPVALRGAR